MRGPISVISSDIIKGSPLTRQITNCVALTYIIAYFLLTIIILYDLGCALMLMLCDDDYVHVRDVSVSVCLLAFHRALSVWDVCALRATHKSPSPLSPTNKTNTNQPPTKLLPSSYLLSYLSTVSASFHSHFIILWEKVGGRNRAAARARGAHGYGAEAPLLVSCDCVGPNPDAQPDAKVEAIAKGWILRKTKNRKLWVADC